MCVSEVEKKMKTTALYEWPPVWATLEQMKHAPNNGNSGSDRVCTKCEIAVLRAMRKAMATIKRLRTIRDVDADEVSDIMAKAEATMCPKCTALYEFIRAEVETVTSAYSYCLRSDGVLMLEWTPHVPVRVNSSGPIVFSWNLRDLSHENKALVLNKLAWLHVWLYSPTYTLNELEELRDNLTDNLHENDARGIDRNSRNTTMLEPYEDEFSARDERARRERERLEDEREDEADACADALIAEIDENSYPPEEALDAVEGARRAPVSADPDDDILFD